MHKCPEKKSTFSLCLAASMAMQPSPGQWDVIAEAPSWPWGQGLLLRVADHKGGSHLGSPAAVEQRYHIHLPLYLYLRQKLLFCLSHCNPASLLQLLPLRASFSLPSWDSLSIIRHCYWWEGDGHLHWKTVRTRIPGLEVRRLEFWVAALPLASRGLQTLHTVWYT